MKKICFVTLGCKVNKYESDVLASALKDHFEILSEIGFADYYILNTCAVTNEGEKKSRQAISKVLKLNPQSEIIVCGCASQNNKLQFENKNNVIAVFGNKDKLDIISFLLARNNVICDSSYSLFPIKNSTRSFLKIQDGCNRFCSYCIIPYVRGRSVSKNFLDVLCEARELSQISPEIVIVGIDISDFMWEGERALDKLILALGDLPCRLRISSMENNIISENFLKNLSLSKNFAPHFHLSLQSGDDEVLKKMNRRYDTSTFLEKCNLIRKCFPDANITTDIIVGMPGETDKQFENTCEFVKRAEFGSIHIFPYSKREGTVAATWEPVSEDIKKARVKKLQEIERQLSDEFLDKNRGKERVVLVEEKVGDYFVGYSENYIKVYLSVSVNRVENDGEKTSESASEKVVMIGSEKVAMNISDNLKMIGSDSESVYESRINNSERESAKASKKGANIELSKFYRVQLGEKFKDGVKGELL